jgi:hypothetical protein
MIFDLAKRREGKLPQPRSTFYKATYDIYILAAFSRITQKGGDWSNGQGANLEGF